MSRITIKELHDTIGITKDTPGYGSVFGPKSREKFSLWLSNPKAPALTEQDYKEAAEKLDVPIKYMKGIRKVEAPRGPYDDLGRPNILFERHKFRNNTVPVGRFNASHPDLSGGPYGAGGYGKFSTQYDKLLRAASLDPYAAIAACSWGAFQVLGENWEDLKYASILEMITKLVQSEAGHLDSFVRFVIANKLQDELRACKPNDPNSCVPFVSVYNGPGYKDFNYHHKLAVAIA